MADLITCPRCDGKGYVTLLLAARKGTCPCPKCHSCGKIKPVRLESFRLPDNIVRHYEAKYWGQWGVSSWDDLLWGTQRPLVPDETNALAALRDQVKALGERLEVLEAARPIPAVAPYDPTHDILTMASVPLNLPLDQRVKVLVAERDEARKAFDDAYASLGQAVAERDNLKALSAARLVDLDVCTARLDSAEADRAATERALGEVKVMLDEAREYRDNATDALNRIWDIFPVGDDEDDVENDDISYEPLIRRARMAADILTAARAEVRGLHAALDQVIAARDEALAKAANARWTTEP